MVLLKSAGEYSPEQPFYSLPKSVYNSKSSGLLHLEEA